MNDPDWKVCLFSTHLSYVLHIYFYASFSFFLDPLRKLRHYPSLDIFTDQDMLDMTLSFLIQVCLEQCWGVNCSEAHQNQSNLKDIFYVLKLRTSSRDSGQ